MQEFPGDVIYTYKNFQTQDQDTNVLFMISFQQM